MDENKNIKKNTNSEELDVLVSDTSKTPHELPKRTRIIPVVKPAESEKKKDLSQINSEYHSLLPSLRW